jgi:hypothetical protein
LIASSAMPKRDRSMARVSRIVPSIIASASSV